MAWKCQLSLILVSVTALLSPALCTARIVVLAYSNSTAAVPRLGKPDMHKICDQVTDFKCNKVWTSGVQGAFLPTTDAAPNVRVRLQRLVDTFNNVTAVVVPSQASLKWQARLDQPLAGKGGSTKSFHVTSQSDFSDFFVESKLSVLETSEDTVFKLSDPQLPKVQKNAPLHLRQISGEAIDDPDTSFRFYRFSTGANIYMVDGIMTSTHDEFKDLFDGMPRVSRDSFASDSAAAQFTEDPKCASDHGTHVSSLAGGYGYSVAKNSTLISVGVQPGCGQSGFASDLIQGLSWVLDHYTAQPHPRPPSVVSMSLLLGASAAADEVERMVNELVSAGVIVVAAAGNYREDACSFVPARMSNVITVGALADSFDQPWDWSNWGSCVDVWSPGENVLGASPDCDKCTAVFSGTSQATPIVSGMVAHALEFNPKADTDAVLATLQSASTQLPGIPEGSNNIVVQFVES